MQEDSSGAAAGADFANTTADVGQRVQQPEAATPSASDPPVGNAQVA